MSRNNEEGLKPVDFFEIADGLLPTLPWFPRTEVMAERSESYMGYREFVDSLNIEH